MCLFRYISDRLTPLTNIKRALAWLFFFYEDRFHCASKIYAATRYAEALSEICSLIARRDDGRRGKRSNASGSRRQG
jgi:hypothetical protein